MNYHRILFATLFCFILTTVSAQQKDSETNANKEITKTVSIEELVNSKTFEFTANTAYPSTGTAPVNLVGSNYSVTFSPELIISFMPYYGRVSSGMSMSRDKGMRFEGSPEAFIVISNEKGHEVQTKVKDENDTFSISMSVSDSGYATLTISSKNKGTISYHGEVVNVQ
jgi:hypothetical protein